jgi:hypothetical protein
MGIEETDTRSWQWWYLPLPSHPSVFFHMHAIICELLLHTLSPQSKSLVLKHLFITMQLEAFSNDYQDMAPCHCGHQYFDTILVLYEIPPLYEIKGSGCSVASWMDAM